MLNKYPVFKAKYFQYRADVSFDEVVIHNKALGDPLIRPWVLVSRVTIVE